MGVDTPRTHRSTPRSSHPPLLRTTVTNLQDHDPAVLRGTQENAAWQELVFEARRANRLEGPHRISALERLARRFAVVFGDSSIDAKAYPELKAEAVFLAELTRHSLLHMAIRLLAIRDRQLYRQDGYDDFKSFVEAELPVSRSTAYNYMDIVRYFGIRQIEEVDDFEYSKLLPVIPLLKEPDDRIPKRKLKQYFIRIAGLRSRREIEREARELKRRYGLSDGSRNQRTVRPEYILNLVKANLHNKPSSTERAVYQEIVALIEQSLESDECV